jgi:transcription antitermination factor NusG
MVTPGDKMNSWYVIQTKPKKEEEATSYLCTKGLEVFSPLIGPFIVKKGRINGEYRPLFPSYIFGRFDIEENYSLVRWGRGVRKILGSGNSPTPIAEEVVEIIKRRTDGHGIVRNNYPFETNDKVRIKSGPMKDFVGIFERWVSENDRVRILLNLIGYQPAIELHYSMIEKVT